MEEADQILLLTLARAGCAAADGLRTLAEVTSDGDVLVAMCAACLKAIAPADPTPAPTKLPAEMSGRFRVGTDLASKLRALGYTRELGFDQFLYPNEADTRAMLKFLLDKMPKAADEAADVTSGAEGGRTRGRSLSAAERAEAAVAAAFRRHHAAARKAIAAGAKRGTSSSRDILRTEAGLGGGGLAAVVAAATEDARRNHRETRPFRTVPLGLNSNGDGCRVAFTSRAPKGYLAPSLLEYTAGSVVSAQMKADAQLARLAAAASSEEEKTEGEKRTVLLVDAAGVPIGEVDIALLKKAGIGGALDAARAASEKRTRSTPAGGAAGVTAGAAWGGGDARDASAGAISGMEAEAAAAAAEASAAKDAAAAEGDTMETRVGRREAELVELRDRLRESAGEVAAAEAATEEAARVKATAAKEKTAEEARTKALEADYLLHKQTTGLVLGTERPVAESEAELEKSLAAAERRTEALRAEWDAARAPLEGELAKHAAAAEARRHKAKEQLEAVQRFRAEMRDLALQARKKEDEQRALIAEYEAAPKNVQRPSFVRRINEIVKNVKKQEGEIVKIVNDTREIQREIDVAQDAMARAYAIVEDILYRDAKGGGDQSCKEAYRLLSAVHSGFAELTSKVDETGRCGKAQREVERKLEELEKQPVNVERVAEDVKAVLAEIDALEKKVGVVKVRRGAVA